MISSFVCLLSACHWFIVVYLQMLVMYPQSSWQTTYSRCLIHDCPPIPVAANHIDPWFLLGNQCPSSIFADKSTVQYTTSAVSWLELEMETDVWLASWPRSWKMVVNFARTVHQKMVKPQALDLWNAFSLLLKNFKKNKKSENQSKPQLEKNKKKKSEQKANYVFSVFFRKQKV